MKTRFASARRRRRARPHFLKLATAMFLGLASILPTVFSSPASASDVGSRVSRMHPFPSEPVGTGYGADGPASSPTAETAGPGALPRGAVAYTLDAFNRTLIPGTFQPDYGGFDVSAEYFNATTQRLYLGASGGDVLVVNGTSGIGEYVIPTPGGVLSLAMDGRTGDLWTAGGAPNTVSVINTSSEKVIVPNIQVPDGAFDIVYDSTDQRMFVASSYNSTVCAINATSGELVGRSIDLPFQPSALFYDATGDRVFVGDSTGYVHVLDGATLAMESTVWAVGPFPDAFEIDPIHNWLYVANGGSGNVSVINLTSGKIESPGIPVGSGPVALQYYPSNRSMLVANYDSSNVTELPSSGSVPSRHGISIRAGAGPLALDPRNDEVFTTEGTPGGPPATYLAVIDPAVSSGLRFSIQVSYDFVSSAFDSADGNLYVVNPAGQNGTGNLGSYPPYPPGNSSVMVINGTSRQLLSTSYPVGYGAIAIAYDAANRDLYVANEGSGTVSIIDPAHGAVSTLGIGSNTSPVALSVDPSRNLVYVADSGTDNVTVIDGTHQTVLAVVPVGIDPDAVVYDAGSDRVYVANSRSDNLTVVNASSLHATGSIPVGEFPSALGWVPGTADLFVANFPNSLPPNAYSNLTVINTTSNRSVGSVTVGFGPDSMAYDPTNGYLYVANGYSYNVTVINPLSLDQVPPGIPVDRGYAESYPTSVTYDPLTEEVVVTTTFSVDFRTF